MGQKTNIMTLKKATSNYSLLSESTKNLMFFVKFYTLLVNLFKIRGLILDNFSLNKINNKFYVSFSLFFSASKIQNYQKKEFFKKKVFNSLQSLKTLFGSSLFLSRLLILNVKILNKSINKNIVKNLYRNFRHTKKTLFSRRYLLFIDFLVLSSLYSQGSIKNSLFLSLLGRIFQVLPKKKHRSFLFFLKSLFLFLVSRPAYFGNFSKSKIRGIKFTISGRFLGKLRSSTNSIQLGTLPRKTIDSNIEFSQTNVYTLLGAFGFKL